MQISEINISIIKPKNGLLGFVSMVLNGEFYISGIAVHQKLNCSGYRLTYPTRKSGDKNFDLFHPINKQTSSIIENAVFKELKDVMNKVDNNVRYDSNKFTEK